MSSNTGRDLQGIDQGSAILTRSGASQGPAERPYDDRRRASRPWRVWYGLKAWLEARRAQLAREPLCERCKAQSLVVAATVVNHRIPHKGDWGLFIDPGNHESTCKPCHDRDIQLEERGRPRVAIGADGWPMG